MNAIYFEFWVKLFKLPIKDSIHINDKMPAPIIWRFYCNITSQHYPPTSVQTEIYSCNTLVGVSYILVKATSDLDPSCPTSHTAVTLALDATGFPMGAP